MGTTHLTHRQKMEWLPIWNERDYDGVDFKHWICFYCGQEFDDNSKYMCRIHEHLNNNDRDNRPENIVFAHVICNEEKKSNPEWQLRAKQKLKDNVAWASKKDLTQEGAYGGERIFSQHKQTSNEADVAAVLYKHSVQLLAEELLPRGDNPAKRKLNEGIPLKEAAECVDYRTKKETGGCGSQSAAQRHLETLSCTISEEYERKIVNGKQIIFRRTGQ